MREREIEKKGTETQHQRMFMDYFDFSVVSVAATIVIIIMFNVSAAVRASRFPLGVVFLSSLIRYSVYWNIFFLHFRVS